MKISEINDWLSLLANIGVLAGIFFLAIEIQQNTQMIESQTRNSITENIVASSIPAASNEYSANVLLRGFRGEIEPQTGESITWVLFSQSIFRNWENEWYQYRSGLFAENEFGPRMRNWYGLLELVGFRNYWAENREIYSESFREQIDRVISETSPSQ